MDTTKKSMKWLVTLFVVFAMLFTAVFAASTVATAKADTETRVDLDVIVVAESDAGAFPNLLSGTTHTITAYYYMDTSVLQNVTLTESFFEPVITSGNTTIPASSITVNMGSETENDDTVVGIAGTASDNFNGLTVSNGTYTVGNYLFSAKFEVSDPGEYTFDFGALTEFGANHGTTYYVPTVKTEQDVTNADEDDLDAVAKGSFNIRTEIPVPTITEESRSYNGEVQTYSGSGTGYTFSASGDVVGDYDITITLTDPATTQWTNAEPGAETANITQEDSFHITPKQITKPSISASYKIYNGQSQTHSGSGAGYSFTGSGTNAGEYPVTVTLTDKDNTEWNDSTTADYEVADKLVINKKTVKLTLSETAESSVYGNPVATITAGINPDYAPINTADIGTLTYTAQHIQTNVIYTKADFETLGTAPVGNYILTAACSIDNPNYSVDAQTLPYAITKRQIEIPVLNQDDPSFVYNGSEQGISFFSGSLDDADYFTLSGTNSATNVGNYTYTATLNDATNCEWEDETTAAKNYYWSITTLYITVPTVEDDTFEYDGNEHSIGFSNVDNTYVDITYDTQSAVGVYTDTTTVALKAAHAGNIAWDDEGHTTAAKTYTLTIGKKAVTLSFNDDEVSFTSVYGAALANIQVNASGLVNSNDLGTLSYAVTQNDEPATLSAVGTYTLTTTYTANDNYEVTIDTASYEITTKQVTKPTADSTTFTYNGGNQTYNLATSSDYTITGTTTKTNAGSNTITVALADKDNTVWSTGGTADVEYTFTINPKAVTLDFYDSDDEEPWHLTFVCTYPDSMYYITVKATGLIGANDLGELGFIATNDTTHEVADITVAGAPAGYYTLTPTYTPNANYNVTALEGSARIYVLNVIVPVVVTDTYDYDGTAKAIVFDEVTSQGYSQYYTITGNSLTEPGTTTVTVALKDEYAGNVIWGYDARVDEFLDTTDDQTFTLTVNSPLITVTFTYSYGESVTTIEEDVEVNFVSGTMRALPSFRFFKTAGWRVNGEGDVVTAYTKDMDGKTLNAEFVYAVGMGDANGDGMITTADVIQMRRHFLNKISSDLFIEEESQAWEIAQDTTDEGAYFFVNAIDVNGTNSFRTTDIVALREALATGYDFRVINFFDDEAQISYQKVVQAPQTVYSYEELVNYVSAGYPVSLGNDIDAATKDFNLNLQVPADIDLNGKTLTVNTFTLNNDNAGATLAVSNSATNATGSIYTVQGITITAPNGNVIVDNVSGYLYEGENVTLAAYTSSLHIESNVGFYQYKVEGKANAAEYKASVTTDTAINTVSKGEQGIIAITEAKVAQMVTAKAEHQAAVEAKEELVAGGEATQQQIDDAEALIASKAAAIDEIPVFKAPVTVPVDTHVVVETNAKLVVEQVTVVDAMGSNDNASTFSINVKSADAEVITVDVQAKKTQVDYVVEEVALEGNTSKVEIVKAQDQSVAATVEEEDPTNVAMIDKGTTIALYATLGDAVAALKDGETIKVLADIDFSTADYVNYKWAGNTYTPLVITKNNVTLDLNGHTFSNMGNNAIVAGNLKAADGKISNFTMKNGTLLAGKTDGVTNSYVFDVAGVDGALIKNVTTVGGMNAYSVSTNVVFEDCTIQGTKYYTVCSQTGSEVIIRGTTFTKNTDSSVATPSMFWVDGHGTESDLITDQNPTGAKEASSLTIEGGNFVVKANGNFHLVGKNENGVAHLKPVVKGGTYNFDPTAYLAPGYAAVEEDGIWTVINGTLVMNETELKAALASDAEKIVIGQSFSISTAAPADRINVTRDVVLDLNGYTLTCAEYMFVVQPGATFEITGNGTICYNGSNASAGALCVMGSADQATETVSKLIVGENVTVQSSGYGIVIWHNNFKSYGSEVVVEGTINAATTAICPSGNIAQQTGDVVDNEPISTIAKITVKNTAVLTASTSSGIYAAGFAVWDIEAGASITGASAMYIKSGFVSVPNGVILTATKATVATYSYNGNGGNVTGDGIVIDNCYYPGANAVVTFGDNLADTITVTAESAKKIGTYWAVESKQQFDEAKNANANYIYIKNDITLAKNTFLSWKAGNGDLTLDLAGHKISGSYTYVFSWSISGTSLNIIDTSASHTGEIVNTSTATAPYALSIGDTGNTVNIYGGTINAKIAIKVGNATLNIYGGTIKSEASDKYAILNYQGKNGTINLEDGTIIATNVGIQNDGTGTVNLKGGTINAGVDGVMNKGTGTINVNGTAITSDVTGVESHEASIGAINMISGSITATNGIATFNKTADGATVNVTGGTITATNVAISTNGNDTYATSINVSGGTFLCADEIIKNSSSHGVASVTGGTFDHDPSAYLAEGYEATEVNGIWTVGMIYEAQIGATKYVTFDEAVAAAQPNDTVVLLRDVTFGTGRSVPVWAGDFDLDLNGKTFTTNSEVGKTLSNNGYTASAICFGDPTTVPEPARTISITNGTIRTAYGAGVYIDGAVTATLEGLTVAQNYPQNVQTTDEYSAAVRVTSFAHVIINNGSYSGKNAITISNSGGYIDIYGGDFRGNLFISSGEPAKAKVLTIYGGTFDHDPTAYVDTDNYDVTYADGIYTVTAKA